MSIKEKMIAPFSNNRLIILYNKFLGSIYFPLFLCVFCFITSISEVNIYIPCLWIMMSTVVLGAIFNPDTKFFIAAFFIMFYGLGNDASNQMINSETDIFSSFHHSAYPHFAALITVYVLSLLYRLIINGKLPQFNKRSCPFLFGIIILASAFIANGLFSPNFGMRTFLYGALFAFGITVSYFFGKFVLNDQKNVALYTCKCMLCFGYTVLLQLTNLMLKIISENKLFFRYPSGEIIMLNRDYMFLSWGVATMLGAGIAIAIPAALYLALNEKFSPIYFFSALIFLAYTPLLARSALLCGTIITVVSAVILCKKGKNQFTNRICTVITLVIGLIGAVTVLIALGGIKPLWEKIVLFLRLDHSNSPRIILIEKGLSDFSSAPIFGNGFINANNCDLINPYSKMYHNIIVQIFASTGIIGALAFIFHLLDHIIVLLKKRCSKTLLLYFTPLLLLMMSVFDNFFFYFNFQMIYGVFLALLEHDEVSSEIVSNDSI